LAESTCGQAQGEAATAATLKALTLDIGPSLGSESRYGLENPEPGWQILIGHITSRPAAMKRTAMSFHNGRGLCFGVAHQGRHRHRHRERWRHGKTLHAAEGVQQRGGGATAQRSAHLRQLILLQSDGCVLKENDGPCRMGAGDVERTTASTVQHRFGDFRYASAASLH